MANIDVLHNFGGCYRSLINAYWLPPEQAGLLLHAVLDRMRDDPDPTVPAIEEQHTTEGVDKTCGNSQ